MITVRKSEDRGATKLGWLDSKHTFSFNRYYDPRHMGFRSLRVINDDVVSAGGIFGTHPHENMEILTWVLSGSVVHKDSTGAAGEIRPGDLQKMSAGTGIFHSEANGSKTDSTHFYQIWILPQRSGLEPSYGQKHFPVEERTNRLRLVASRDGRDGSVLVHQDAEMLTGILDAGAEVAHSASGRHIWVQVGSGRVDVNGIELKAGDGAQASGEDAIRIEALERSEVIVFDLA
jgi:hypothetical protein